MAHDLHEHEISMSASIDIDLERARRHEHAPAPARSPRNLFCTVSKTKQMHPNIKYVEDLRQERRCACSMPDTSSSHARPPPLAQGGGPLRTSLASNSSPNHSSLRWPAVRVQGSPDRPSQPAKVLKCPCYVNMSALALTDSPRR